MSEDTNTLVDDDLILYRSEDGVATIVLNRPRARNAINLPMRVRFGAALARAVADADVRSIVIAANGAGFSAGTDLEEASGITDTYALLEEEYKPLIKSIRESPKPVIAAINGACAGVGASLALACDLAVMGENAFLFLAFAQVGLVPDGGMCWQLVNAMGYKHAFALIAEGGRLSADECRDYGLVNKVVPDDQIVAEALAWAKRLSQGAPLAQKYSKFILQQAARSQLEDIMRLEASLQQVCASSADGREGGKAFLEKRKPVFTGS